MIYFDNSATSFPKPKGMIEEMDACLFRYCGNPGRSGHDMSMKMGEKIYEARKEVAALFGVKDPSRIIFTKNTTEALNMALRGFLQEGDHVITTSMEHNSVLRPLKALEKDGVRHTIVKGDSNGYVTAKKIEDAICDDTKLIAMTGASNITGTCQPVKEVGKIASDRKIAFLLDAAQCAGNSHIDLEMTGISMAAFPGHKGLLGPPGTGGLYVAPWIHLQPLLYGGTGTRSKSILQPEEYPEGFESGTVNGPGIIGLGHSVKVVRQIGVETIAYYERALITMLEEEIKNMNHVICYGPQSKQKTGICLFNLKNLTSEEVTERLNREYGIAVRGGYHCAGMAHQTIGTGRNGAVRLSVGPFNTRKEIKSTIAAIWKLKGSY